MKHPFFFSIILLFSFYTYSQVKLNTNITFQKNNPIQVITIDESNTLFPVQIIGAFYNSDMNNMPMLASNYQTNTTEGTTYELQEIQTIPLNETQKNTVNKYFSKYIENSFKITASNSQSGNTLYWRALIVPFKKDNSGNIYYLSQYKIVWNKHLSEKARTLSIQAFTNQSVLSSGNWYKIGIKNTGLYKIDKTFLQNMGINVSQIDPRNIRIYGNGGQMLPKKNNIFRYDDLQENAIYVSGQSDGVFDNTDYILFYGKGSDEWKTQAPTTASCLNYYHNYHDCSDSAFYFLNFDIGTGKRIADVSVSAPPTYTTNTYDYYNYHELEAVNFLKSGPDFYGEYFDIQNSYTFPFADNYFVVGDTIKAFMSIAARGDVVTNFNWVFNGTSNSFTAAAVTTSNYLADYASVASQCKTSINNNANVISFTINKLTSGTIAWLDKIVFNARRYLIYTGNTFEFRDRRTIAPGGVATFSIATNTNNLRVWDITDITNPYNQVYNQYSGFITFNAATDSLHKYTAFTDNNTLTPVFVKKVDNQNLHAVNQADFVLVVHPKFKQQALDLAQFHNQVEGYTYAVVTTEEVYNEFSSGNVDATALRDFVRMLYNRNAPSSRPRYFLLFGDGSYLNKDRTVNNSAYIPVYETGNSVSPTLSTVTDDFYGWLDPNEGDDWSMALVDVGVGRFTVKNTAEATNVVNKVKAYYKINTMFTPSNNLDCCNNTNVYPQGDWRTWLTFFADDKDSQLHMQQADSLSRFIELLHPEYDINKIYADAYQEISVPGGQRYPDASAALDKAFEKGSLVINYTGHGNEVGLGHEAYLTLSQINSYKNLGNMPLFVTATCEFTRFDDPDRVSAGEQCFLQANGCAIALFTTVRLAYASTNFYLSRFLFQELVDTLPGGTFYALGDIVKKTKQLANIGFYFLNFHLIGDPALTLSYPRNKIFITAINNHTLTSIPQDTMKALAKYTIKGFVADKFGNKLTNFNGVVYPTVFDKTQKLTCLGNDAESLIGVPPHPFSYYSQRNVLFRGKAQVINGDFSFTFIVPKDINYSIDTSKISLYAHNGVNDAIGYTHKFYVGGSASNAVIDNQSPTVSLYLNDKKFVYGGTTNENPTLYAEIADSSGINTTGTSIGHDVVATLDNTKQFNLNDYFEYDLNSYQKGKVKYPFYSLPVGTHQLQLKVWDIQNNSATNTTEFIVAQSAELALNHVLNYPNPFSTRTKFMFEHNASCEQLNIIIQIFTISGKIVKTIHQSVFNSGYRYDGIDWDGRDDYGDKLAKGVYIYKVSITDVNNKKAEKIEKLVILN